MPVLHNTMISYSLCLVLSGAFLANGQLYSFDTGNYGNQQFLGQAPAFPASPLQLLNPLRAVRNFKAIVGSLVPPICAPLLGPLAPQLPQPAFRAPLLQTLAARRSIQPPINPLIPQPSLATTLRNLQAAYSAAPPLACGNCNPLLPASKLGACNRLSSCSCSCNPLAPCTCGCSQPACTCGNCGNPLATCRCNQPTCTCGACNQLAAARSPCSCGQSSCTCGACSNPYAAYGYPSYPSSCVPKEVIYEKFV